MVAVSRSVSKIRSALGGYLLIRSDLHVGLLPNNWATDQAKYASSMRSEQRCCEAKMRSAMSGPRPEVGSRSGVKTWLMLAYIPDDCLEWARRHGLLAIWEQGVCMGRSRKLSTR
jgi:hypothetical protein